MNDKIMDLIDTVVDALGAKITKIEGSLDRNGVMLMDVPSMGVASLAVQERDNLQNGAAIALSKEEARELGNALLVYASR